MSKITLLGLCGATLTSAAFAQTVPVPSGNTSEWRMTGVTAGVVDRAYGPGVLEFADGANGATSMVNTFTTCSAAGIPTISGVDAPILRAGRHINPLGYYLRPMHGQAEAASFTLAMDLYFDSADNTINYTALWQSRDKLLDAELHLDHGANAFWHDRDNTGVGAGTVGVGTWSYDSWFRVIYTVDSAAGTAKLFVNGALVMTDAPIDTLPDGSGPAVSWFLSDQNDNSFPLYVGALAVADVAIGDSVAAQLGAPAGDGIFDGGLGAPYCGPAVPNSTGLPGRIVARGSAIASVNDITLEAIDLPPASFGFFLTSQMQNFIMNPGGSAGNLCLGGAIGRYVGPGQVLNSGATGMISLALDLTQTPTPTGLVPVQSGQTWNFQAWHRDSVGSTATSNFTNAVSVLFF
ncbi:MAG: hypothetical protein AAGB93_16620 [Planctomycetota bacterium]